MKTALFSLLAVGPLLCAANSQASLDFASSGASAIQFGPGSTFSITDSTTADASLGDGFAQWHVTTAGAAAGLNGAFSGGPWTFGTVNTMGPIQTANVTTTGGSFAIDDGLGNLLTGNVNWVQVFTLGVTGGLNAGATINVTDLSYSGANAALLALLTSSDGSMDLTFQFGTAESLSQIAAGAEDSTSYSGSLTGAAVPEPATVIAGFLLLLPLGMSTLRILRKTRA
jgi:hypothetical protein